MASVWGGDDPSVAWGYNSWESNTVTQSLTAPTAITASLGDLAYAASEEGWGRDAWGDNNWGENETTVSLTGVSATASLGDLAYAQSEEGWGRDTWGSNQWGEDTIDVTLSGLSITSHLGPDGWGANSFGNGQWGGEFTFKPESIIVPTGVSTSSFSVGSPTVTFDMIFGISGLDAIGSGLGTLSVNNGADHTQGLGSLAVTSSLGTPVVTPNTIADLSGVSSTFSLNADGIDLTSSALIDITGVSTTASVGSISPTEMAVGLTGVSTTGSVGSISPTEMTMGLTGVSTTASVADMTTASGGGIIAYANIDTGSNISYSNIATGSNTSYSDVA